MGPTCFYQRAFLYGLPLHIVGRAFVDVPLVSPILSRALTGLGAWDIADQRLQRYFVAWYAVEASGAPARPGFPERAASGWTWL